MDAAAMAERGRAAEQRGDLSEAWRCWRRAAFDGDESAMRHLARSLRHAHPEEAQLWRWHAVVAGKQRAVGAPPREVAAAADGLGTLRLTFGHGGGSPAEAAVGCAALVVLAVGAVGLVGLVTGVLALAVGAAAVAVVGAVAVIVSWVRTRGRRHVGAWTYERGVVLRDGAGRLTVHPWGGAAVPDVPDAQLPPGEGAVLRHLVGHKIGPVDGATNDVS